MARRLALEERYSLRWGLRLVPFITDGLVDYLTGFLSGVLDRKPLGFIMTVYRRRLTSSLYAILRSLERRLGALQQTASLDEMLDDDDRFALENSLTFEPDQLSEHAAAYAASWPPP